MNLMMITISDHDDQNKNVACSAPHKLFENPPDLLEAETPLVKKNILVSTNTYSNFT